MSRIKSDSTTEVVRFDPDANVKEISDRAFSRRASNKVFSSNPRFSKDKVGKEKRRPKKRKLIEKVEIDEKQIEDNDVDDISELQPERVKTKLHVKKITKKKETFKQRIEAKIRAELLNADDNGGVDIEEGKETYFLEQKDIVNAVDTAAASKHFTLDLDYGPYKGKYIRNGRHLLLAGHKGHLAAFDWMTKTLHCEVNVTEKVNDIAWLHSENMFAAAQRRWTYIYDKNGVELHCVKSLFNVHSLEFLPKHFLLVALSNENFLSYMDVSTGEMVQSWRIKQKETTCMTQNPSNAIIVSGNTKGVVCMWSPNSKEAIIEMLAHKAPLSDLAISRDGKRMVTVGLDRQLKVWDLRNYKEMSAYKLPFPPSHVTISQMGQVAVGCGVNVQVYSDPNINTITKPFLTYRAPSSVSSLQFCPYEDVLGIGHAHGFASILVPGSGDPNFDALRENPYETKKQRREREVRQLLEKLQPEMITLDPTQINKVNRSELEKKIEYRDSVMHWSDAKQINRDPSRYFERKKILK
ncbi:unnamed protein product [Bursaphelenchus xylophilus]|uniref:(pine wood nematode) hypothetical protein n=1 Tax=Bursaphelenchus xylophilus TaxID=6326 RepID=A0A1I7RU44_BURXY|nr:unnamed protein product [Bursaphelenchus xylophilus]CAG9113807.1 unnamed protein product [Bursaphelenchus xylophilus]